MSRKITVCGRVHLGPCCVNGGPPPEYRPICVSCGDVITQEDRELIGRMWDTVNQMLARHKVQP